MERLPPEDVFIEDEQFGWDEEQTGTYAAPRPAPPTPPQRRRSRRRKRPRTLAGDIRRFRDAIAARPAPFLAGLAALAAVVLAVVLLGGGGGTKAPTQGSRTRPKKAAVPAVLPAGLRVGDHGEAVRRLQQSLAAVGLYTSAVDGIFGQGTKAAVVSFQRSHGLPATGVSDRATTRALESAAAEHAAPEAAAVRRGLEQAAAAGRLSSAAVTRHGATLTRAATSIARLPAARAAILSAVLHDVAVQAPRYDEPRALALFGMLDANRAYLERNDVTAERQDITDADGVVYRFYTGHGFQFQPLANFARLNAHVTEKRPEVARRLAAALVARGIPERNALYWEYFFPFQGPSHWTSGLAQAVAAQSLARTGDLVHEPAFATAAHSAFRAVPETLSRPLGGGLWIREYGFSDIAILNAQLQSLVSLTDYAKLTNAADVHRVVARMDVASRTLLPQFDTGCWSRYSLGGSDADLHYHTYHVQLLRRLASTRPAAVWKETGDRWSRFLRNRALPCGQR